MSCLGFATLENKPCSELSDCGNHTGCFPFESVVPATNFNMGHENKFPDNRGLQRKMNATGSWPCRGQQTCNFFGAFDGTNPVLDEKFALLDLLALPPN